MLGSLYGHYSRETPEGLHKLEYLGSADSNKRYLRCAFYAREQKQKPEEMDKYFARDEDAYTIAALYNNRLFLDVKTRPKLEQCLRGRLIYRYKVRCEQLHAKRSEFDPKPVSEDGASLLDDETAQATDDQKRLDRLEALVAANSKQLIDISKRLLWVLVLVVVAVLLIWRPHL